MPKPYSNTTKIVLKMAVLVECVSRAPSGAVSILADTSQMSAGKYT